MIRCHQGDQHLLQVPYRFPGAGPGYPFRLPVFAGQEAFQAIKQPDDVSRVIFLHTDSREPAGTPVKYKVYDKRFSGKGVLGDFEGNVVIAFIEFRSELRIFHHFISQYPDYVRF